MNKRFKRPRQEQRRHTTDGQRCLHCDQSEFEIISGIDGEEFNELQVLTHPNLKGIVSNSDDIADQIPQFKITDVSFMQPIEVLIKFSSETLVVLCG